MNGQNFDNFKQYFNGLKKQLKELKHKRKQLDIKIKKYINNFQIIESEIYKSLFEAKEFYNNKRHFYNKKITTLKRKIIEYEQFLISFIEKKKNLQKPKLINEISKVNNAIKKSNKQIEDKIDYLNKILKTQILDINNEKEIVEKIGRLERKKQERAELLLKMKQKLIADLHKSDYYKVHEKIEILKNDIAKCKKHLDKLYNIRRINHKKMLDLYRKANTFNNYKKKMENELKENKNISEHQYLYFLEIIGQNEEILGDIKHFKSKDKHRERQIKKPELVYVIERKKLYKKFRKEKLAIALEKQKAGKKMHINEFKLILDESKK